MSRFQIQILGPAIFSPVDKVADSATEAKHKIRAVLEVFGVAAKVTIRDQGGERVPLSRLAFLARAEGLQMANTRIPAHIGSNVTPIDAYRRGITAIAKSP